jgi:hypothetical protein
MTPNNGFPAPDPFSSQGADVRRKQTTMMIIIGLLLAIVAAIVGLSAAGVLRFGREAPKTGTLQAKGAMPDNRIMAKPSVAPAPVLEKGGERPEMPADVRDWLDHLRRCEELKMRITGEIETEMAGEAASFKTGVSSPGQVEDITNPETSLDKLPANESFQNLRRRIATRFSDLQGQFISLPPPEECKTLAYNFSMGLEGLVGETDKIIGIIGGINLTDRSAQDQMRDSVTELQRINTSHRETVDRPFREAQSELEKVCRRYDVNPWFGINSSGTSNGLMNKIGIAGG